MAIRSLKASELTGRNIYQIKNQTIYSNFLMKDYGYIIPDYEADKYRSYSLRGFESVFGFILLVYVSKQNMLLSLSIPILAYIVLSLMFHLKFLPSLPKHENFKKPKRDNYIVSTAKEMSVVRILVITIMCTIFTFAIALYPVYNNYGGTFKIILYVIAIASGAFTLLNLFSLLYKIFNKI